MDDVEFCLVADECAVCEYFWSSEGYGYGSECDGALEVCDKFVPRKPKESEYKTGEALATLSKRLKESKEESE